jgi:hypothetical protein
MNSTYRSVFLPDNFRINGGMFPADITSGLNKYGHINIKVEGAPATTDVAKIYVYYTYEIQLTSAQK